MEVQKYRTLDLSLREYPWTVKIQGLLGTGKWEPKFKLTVKESPFKFLFSYLGKECRGLWIGPARKVVIRKQTMVGRSRKGLAVG